MAQINPKKSASMLKINRKMLLMLVVTSERYRLTTKPRPLTTEAEVAFRKIPLRLLQRMAWKVLARPTRSTIVVMS